MAEDKNPKDQPSKMETDKSVAGAHGTPAKADPHVTGVSLSRKTADEIDPTEGHNNASLKHGTWVLTADGEKALFLGNQTDG